MNRFLWMIPVLCVPTFLFAASEYPIQENDLQNHIQSVHEDDSFDASSQQTSLEWITKMRIGFRSLQVSQDSGLFTSSYGDIRVVGLKNSVEFSLYRNMNLVLNLDLESANIQDKWQYEDIGIGFGFSSARQCSWCYGLSMGVKRQHQIVFNRSMDEAFVPLVSKNLKLEGGYRFHHGHWSFGPSISMSGVMTPSYSGVLGSLESSKSLQVCPSLNIQGNTDSNRLVASFGYCRESLRADQAQDRYYANDSLMDSDEDQRLRQFSESYQLEVGYRF